MSQAAGKMPAPRGPGILPGALKQKPLPIPHSSAAGDSGGPAFADFGNGPQVVGLVSWGVNPTNLSNPYGSGSGDITYLTRVAPFNDWILATIPEPGSGSLMLAAALLVGCRRRK